MSQKESDDDLFAIDETLKADITDRKQPEAKQSKQVEDPHQDHKERKRDKKHKKDKKRKRTKSEDLKKLELEVEALKKQQELEFAAKIGDHEVGIKEDQSFDNNVINTSKKRQAKHNQKSEKVQKKEEQRVKDQQMKEEQLRKVEGFNNMQKELYEKIVSQQKKSRKEEAKEDDIDKEAELLIQKMIKAAAEDRESNTLKKPALKRLMMAEKVYATLRKKQYQELFLDKGGCDALMMWIEQMPDGTFPNLNLVQGVLQCIDGLDIETGHLEDSNIGHAIQYYSEGLAGLPQVQQLAKSIQDKWNRQIHQISCTYAEGNFDTQYREFAAKQSKLKKAEDKEAVGEQESRAHIQRNRTGIMLPERNAFDFIERPDKFNESVFERKKEGESGRARMQKTLMRLKKNNARSNGVNKNMATVKIDY